MKPDQEFITSEIDELVQEVGTRERDLIPILHAVQKKYNYLPEPALRRICEITDIRPAEIAGVSTFYDQFRLKPIGEHLIHICTGTACHVKRGPDGAASADDFPPSSVLPAVAVHGSKAGQFGDLRLHRGLVPVQSKGEVLLVPQCIHSTGDDHTRSVIPTHGIDGYDWFAALVGQVIILLAASVPRWSPQSFTPSHKRDLEAIQ